MLLIKRTAHKFSQETYLLFFNSIALILKGVSVSHSVYELS